MQELIAPAARLALAGAAGACWGASVAMLAFVPAVYVAWWRARSRFEAALVGAVYHGIAARSLVVGAVSYFDVTYVQGIAVVSAAATLVGSVWALCWSPAASTTPLRAWTRVVVLTVLTTVPPLGALATGTPLAAAGVWFPGAGVLGLLALTVIAALIRTQPAIAVLMMMIAFARVIGLPALPRSRASNADVVALSTSLELGDAGDYLAQAAAAMETIQAISAETSRIVVAPEAVGGLWLDPPQHAWAVLDEQLRARGQTALVGATRVRGEARDAVVVALGASPGMYQQRVPMPIAMWRPWDNSGAFEPNWGGPTTLRVGPHTLGVLVCWEVGALWSVLGSTLSGADVLVVVANLQWLRGSDAEQAQRQMLTAWSELFALPAVFAANR